MATRSKKVRTIAELMQQQQKAILDAWLGMVRGLEVSSGPAPADAGQMASQTTQLLKNLSTALASEEYDDIEQPAFKSCLDLLSAISSARAKQGFTPSDTAMYIISLKDALLQFMQQEYGHDAGLLHERVLKLNGVVDRLALYTFEVYQEAREEVIREQSRSILELSTPVIKLWDRIILVPLIGVVDTARARDIMERVLAGIVEYAAEVAILDVTGVPVIDTRVAQHMLNTVSAARMLGAEVLLTGINPDAAATMTKLGIDLSSIRTCGTLRKGVATAFDLLDLRIVSNQE